MANSPSLNSTASMVISRHKNGNNEVVPYYDYHIEGSDGEYGVPMDAVEVVSAPNNFGIQAVLDHLDKLPPPNKNSPTMTALVIVGYTNIPTWKGTKRADPRVTLRELAAKTKEMNRVPILVDYNYHITHVNTIHMTNGYGNIGYHDWGLTYYPEDKSLGNLAFANDVACLWNSDNSVATIIIPEGATYGGLMKARTVMKKANVMISTAPPVEYMHGRKLREGFIREGGYDMVSYAHSTWEPDLHIFAPEGEGDARVYSNGDQHRVRLTGQSGNHVLRWSIGDEGRMYSPSGFPINDKYYKGETK